MRRFNKSLFAFAALAALLLTSCVTGSSQYQISVGNGHPARPVSRIRVQADGREISSYDVIAPTKMAASKPRQDDLPETLTVSWTDAEGTQHSRDVNVADEVSESFRGQLVLQIEEDQTLSLLPVESTGKDMSVLPWNVPAEWEGSIGVPGFDQ